jgi:hypothetical protein
MGRLGQALPAAGAAVAAAGAAVVGLAAGAVVGAAAVGVGAGWAPAHAEMTGAPIAVTTTVRRSARRLTIDPVDISSPPGRRCRMRDPVLAPAEAGGCPARESTGLAALTRWPAGIPTRPAGSRA